jgi:hypothetical protein
LTQIVFRGFLQILNSSRFISGDPKPSDTWSKDGKQIKDGGRYSVKCDGDVYTLLIKDATEADGGSYKLTAKSIAGEINSDVKVKIQTKPKLVGKMEDVTLVEGGVIKIKSTIEGLLFKSGYTTSSSSTRFNRMHVCLFLSRF